MTAWWQQLEKRERLTVMAGTVLLLVMLIVSLIDSHVSNKEMLSQKLIELESTHSWMLEAAVQVKISAPTQKRNRSNQSLLALVDSGTKRSKLADSIKRIQPEGSDKVKIWLEDTPIPQLIRTLSELDRTHAIRTHALTLERTNKAGQISGNITLTRSN